MIFSIWVDADSCPVEVRTAIIKASVRLGIKTYFVANRIIPVYYKGKIPAGLVKMVQTGKTQDAADDYIVSNASINDIVITRDIPLASRLVEKRIIVINDRGTSFSSENIKEYLSIRNFNLELAHCGMKPDKTISYNAKNLNDFSNCLDREIQRKLRQV